MSSAPPPAAASRSGTAAARPARRRAAGVEARPRTQSSIAVRGAEGPWLLANASPDLRQQLEGLAGERVDGVRAAPVAGGAAHRRRDRPHGGPAAAARVLDAASRVRERAGAPGPDRRLSRAADPRRATPASIGARSSPGARSRSTAPRSRSRPFAAGGDAPRYLAGTGADVEATGLVFRDRSTGGVLTYVPGLARLDDDVLCRLAASDVVLVDGTFWRDDELARLGISDRTAAQMGHVPLSGPGGTLEALAAARAPALDPGPHQQHEPDPARALARARRGAARRRRGRRRRPRGRGVAALTSPGARRRVFGYAWDDGCAVGVCRVPTCGHRTSQHPYQRRRNG